MSEKSLNNKIWNVKECCPRNVELLAAELDINPVVARILTARGLDDTQRAGEFLGITAKGFHDPWSMRDMDRAVNHIARALTEGRKICIYGDYDADGIASVALLLRFFRFLGFTAGYYIPHRVEEGYGLNTAAITKIAGEGYDFVVTVDTGATAIEEVEYARSLGLEVVVTDHHQVKDRLPDALAVVDPARADCDYAYSELSGVGVVYKLISAMCDVMKVPRERADEFLTENLDLVALGTIADVVPLTGENRRLAQAGLEILNHTSNLGLSQLISVSRIAGKKIGSAHVGFVLGPRINAAGRTAHASLALHLLLTDDRTKAEHLARQLNRLNDRRQRLGADIHDQCVDYIESSIDLDHKPVIVAAGEGWHEGLLGLVAGKLAERYCRPVFLLNMADGVGKGSGRSYGVFSIFEALKQCDTHLISYGGHHMACGLRLDMQNLSSFDEAINQLALDKMDQICAEQFLDVDAVVTSSDLDFQLTESLEELEPFGKGNPRPVFMMPDMCMVEPPRVVGRNHLKLLVTDGGSSVSAIGFDMGALAPTLARCFKRQRINVAFEPIVNEWNNQTKVEMKLIDIKV